MGKEPLLMSFALPMLFFSGIVMVNTKGGTLHILGQIIFQLSWQEKFYMIHACILQVCIHVQASSMYFTRI